MHRSELAQTSGGVRDVSGELGGELSGDDDANRLALVLVRVVHGDAAVSPALVRCRFDARVGESGAVGSARSSIFSSILVPTSKDKFNSCCSMSVKKSNSFVG